MKKNIKGLITVIKEVIYVLDGKQKRQSVLLLLLLFCSSFFELLGVSTVVPFIQSILMPEQLLSNAYVKSLWNSLGLTDYNSLILIMGLALIGIYIVKNVFIIFVSSIRFNYTTKWQKDIAIRMLRSYMVRPYLFFLNVNSAAVLRGCSDDTENFNSCINQLFVFVTESVTVLIIGIYLVYTDVFTAVCSLILIASIFLGIMVFLKPRVKKAGIVYNRATIARNKSITQTIQGIKDILVMQRKKYFVQDYESAADDVRLGIRNYNIISVLPDRITEGLCVSGVIAIAIIRMMVGGDSATSFVPKLAAFAMASIKVLPSVGKISNCLNTIMFSRPGQHNLYNNIVEAEKIEHELGLYNESKQTVSETDHKRAIEIGNTDFVVEMNQVYWRYNSEQSPVLHGLSLSIKKGESIGLIGSSGGGKTTTVDVLLGLFKPEEGNVTINGKSIYEMPYTWAKLVAYVPQSVFLMDDTVRANVQFGLTDVSDGEVWDALERAQLRSFIESLPEQLDTEVGERGMRFSGGQRQRIAIARALLNKPQILVLDEATAALDNETENAVMEAIEILQGSVTLVIVAHRLTTIRNCDRVYEIKDGIAIEVTDRFTGNEEEN